MSGEILFSAKKALTLGSSSLAGGGLGDSFEEPAPLKRFAHGRAARRGDEVVGLGPDDVARAEHGPPRQGRVRLVDLGPEVGAGHIRHPDVEDQDVHRDAGEDFERLPPPGGGPHPAARPPPGPRAGTRSAPPPPAAFPPRAPGPARAWATIPRSPASSSTTSTLRPF